MNKERDEQIGRLVRLTAADIIRSPTGDINRMVKTLTKRIMELCGTTPVPDNVMEVLAPVNGVWASQVLLPLLEKLTVAYQARKTPVGTVRVKAPCVIGGVERASELFITQRDRNDMQAIIYLDRRSDFSPRLLFHWAVKGSRYPSVEYDDPSKQLGRHRLTSIVLDDDWLYGSREAQHTAAEGILATAITALEKGEYD
jgi:hypothetical protein